MKRIVFLLLMVGLIAFGASAVVAEDHIGPKEEPQLLSLKIISARKRSFLIPPSER